MVPLVRTPCRRVGHEKMSIALVVPPDSSRGRFSTHRPANTLTSPPGHLVNCGRNVSKPSRSGIRVPVEGKALERRQSTALVLTAVSTSIFGGDLPGVDGRLEDDVSGRVWAVWLPTFSGASLYLLHPLRPRHSNDCRVQPVISPCHRKTSPITSAAT